MRARENAKPTLLKRALACLLSAALCVSFTPAVAWGDGDGDEGVPYLDASGASQTCDNVIAVTDEDTTWGDAEKGGWYIAQGVMTISGDVIVYGDVHLILADGCKLTVNGSIAGGSLTIYGQAGGTGALDVTGNFSGGSGDSIEICPGSISGDGVNIIGGTVTSTSISGGNVAISGGVVAADDIIGGAGVNGGNIAISGGAVTAIYIIGGDGSDASVNGGDGGNGGSISISGGVIKATGMILGGRGGRGRAGSSATVGNGGDGGNVTISGGVVFLGGGIIGGAAGSAIEGNGGNDGTVEIDNAVVFRGASGQVYGTGTNLAESFTIPAGTTLTIESGRTLTIPEDVTLTNHGVISISGMLSMTGGIITGTPEVDGGGVYVAGGGRLEMSDGRIVYCTKTNGGGVYVADGAEFAMTGGSIARCRASEGGGGVYVAGGGTFTMTGGDITSCTARQGGGVHVALNGKFIMSGGNIAKCTAETSSGESTAGGGIFNLGTAELSGDAAIRDCKAVQSDVYDFYGGGVCSAGTSLAISGDVTIADCTANGQSDALDAVAGAANSFQISGGTFYCSALFVSTTTGRGTVSGGTFYATVRNSSLSTITGGTFYGGLTNKGTIDGNRVTYDDGLGNTYAIQVVQTGRKVVQPVAPTREGCTFAGWEPELPAVMPAGDITVTARWTYNSYTVPKTTFPITAEGGASGSVQAEGQLVGSKMLISKIDQASLNEFLGSQPESQSSLTLDLTGLGTPVKSTRISRTAMTSLVGITTEESKGVESVSIAMDGGTIELDRQALASIEGQMGSSVEMSVEGKGTSELSAAQQQALAKYGDMTTCVEASITSGRSSIHSFGGGSVSISVSFQPAEGTNPACYKVVYVAEDGSVEYYDAAYSDGRLSFTTSHLSTYAVVYVEPAEATLAATAVLEALPRADELRAAEAEAVLGAAQAALAQVTALDEEQRLLVDGGLVANAEAVAARAAELAPVAPVEAALEALPKAEELKAKDAKAAAKAAEAALVQVAGLTEAQQALVDEALAANAEAVVAQAAALVAKADAKAAGKAKSKKLTVKAGKSKSIAFKTKQSAAGTKVTYKKASGSKYISVSKSGKVTAKKGMKKGKTYKAKVKVTCGNATAYVKVVVKAK